MSLKEQWKHPLYFRDGSGSADLNLEESLFRSNDSQKFAAEELNAMAMAPGGLVMADKLWLEQYGRAVSDDKRRFLTSLPIFITKGAKAFARAKPYYDELIKTFPRHISERTLRKWAEEADELGWLSRERGDNMGDSSTTRNEHCLFFTSYQKYRLLRAVGAIAPNSTVRMMAHRGKPLSGPQR